ncbi:MAG TPA: sulfite oxidase [Blastocatellia bacterium]
MSNQAITRRDFLGGLVLGPLAFRALSAGTPVRVQQSPPVYSAASPYNRAFDFASLNAWIIPNDEFYIRSHSPVPELDPASWTVRVQGAVELPRDFTLKQITALPARELPVTLECAGNLVGYGGVSNAKWSGISLSSLLTQAKVQDGAVEVVLSGADSGYENEGNDIQKYTFQRGIPVSKALDPDTIIAHKMNGESIPPRHGGPLRVIVPGWYGMDSVKWITRIEVIREPFAGFYQSKRYYEARRIEGRPRISPVHEMSIKSQLARPKIGQELHIGPIDVIGAAWGAEIQAVDLSFDGGANWSPATLDQDKAKYAWRIFRGVWRPSRPGAYEIVCRARDDAGRVQPMAKDPDLLSPYQNNWCDRHKVLVLG